jgi:protein involved in plasmid replication-relaxation
MGLYSAFLPMEPLHREPPDIHLLSSLARYQYLTAEQFSRLRYPTARDHNREALRRLKYLVDEGFVLRLRRQPTRGYGYGSLPHVFTLSSKGRQYALDAGFSSLPRPMRPGRLHTRAWHYPFMEHTLRTVDVYIALERLAHEYSHIVAIDELRVERELRALPVYVDLPRGTDGSRMYKTAVIPDGWFQVRVADNQLLSISLEIDRDTEAKDTWRRKVHALSLWALGPYRQAFATDNLTIAVLVPTVIRREQLRAWTHAELIRIGRPELADLFLFSELQPAVTDPYRFFFGAHWYQPHHDGSISLLDLPQAGPREVFSPAP